MAENKNDCTSIGFDWHGAKKEIRCIDGLDVWCIIEANLYECSFLHGYGAGAMHDACAILKDTDYTKSLRDECSGGRFLYDGAAINVIRALQRLLNTH
jgi:homoserine dehydrogenase